MLSRLRPIPCAWLGLLSLAGVGCALDERDLDAVRADASTSTSTSGSELLPVPERSDGDASSAPVLFVDGGDEQTRDAATELPSVSCSAGTHACGEQCLSDFGVASCGRSCEACPVPAGGESTCDGDVCGGACPEDQKLCAGACIDALAACDGECPAGSHDCGGVCVPDTSTSSCGSSCTACPSPPDGDATCDGQSCGFTCREGFHACGERCASDTDVNSCGQACEPCPVPAGGFATCDGVSCGGGCPNGQKLCAGRCILEAQSCQGVCPSGTHDCNGTCQPNGSVNTCGSSCTPCPAPAGNGFATCNGGSCGMGCNAGSRLCGTTCQPNNSPLACGPSCTVCPVPSGGSATCNAGTCGMACPNGSNLCGAACVPNNPDSCGAGCVDCPAPTSGPGSATCSGGVCGLACANGFHRCGNACVSNDSPSSCGSSCAACPAPPPNGAAACTNGACGVVCDDGFFAQDGACHIAAIQVAAGGGHNCALLRDRTVRCWGNNRQGELGNGTTESSDVPVTVLGLSGVRSIASAGDTTCAIIDPGGSVRCWGNNTNGELGNNLNVPSSSTPTAVTGLTGVAHLAVGGDHACVALTSGVVQCWGSNALGAIGTGTAGSQFRTPQTVLNLGSNAIAVGASGNASASAAALSTGLVRSWGTGISGVLGDGTLRLQGPAALSPINVSNLPGATALSMGSGHACALLAGGTVRCWANNGNGQLGDGTLRTPALVPTDVASLSGASLITVGAFHSCALITGGAVRCWGSNFGGALGTGAAPSFDATQPIAVPGLESGVLHIAAGSTGGQTCAVLRDGSVRCWGGQLTTTPTVVPGW